MATKDNKDNHKERTCLKCGKLFMSNGPGNRLCRDCQADNLKYSKSQTNNVKITLKRGECIEQQ